MKKIFLIFFSVTLSSALLYSAEPEKEMEKQSAAKPEKKEIKAEENTSRFAVSTNIVDWGWYITPNIDFQYAIARRFTLKGTAKYNNWTYFNDNTTKRNRQCRQEYSLGVRFWPWYTYSGWWIAADAQYQEYSRRPMSNVFRKEEGDAVGLALSAGYSIHVNSWFNIDVGLGIWSGARWYKTYESADKSCPECGKRVDRLDGIDDPSRGFFFLPNDARIALMFIF